MKKVFKIITLFIGVIIMFTACKGDVNTDLKGQTFRFYDYGLDTYQVYTFKNNGNVYYYSFVCGISFDTKGCSLYYTLEDKALTIYYGTKG